MLKHLRTKLSLIYLISAVILALAVSWGTYSLVSYYFRTTTDQALKVKMGLQFAAMDIPLPLELYDAVRQAGLLVTLPDSEYELGEDPLLHENNEGLQESELADIYVLPLTSEATLLEGYTLLISNISIDKESLRQAMLKGYDLRTVKPLIGTKVRILSYKVPGGFPVQVFQAGRYLTLQEIVLQQLLNTMLLLGFIVTAIIGVAAWLLAGRTLWPTQRAWERQQLFVANASHELRAPLTLIRAGVEVALRDSKSESQKGLLIDVLSDTDHMNQLIEELLLLSRLDAKALELDIQIIDLAVFLPPILRQLALTTSEKGIELIDHIQGFKILADPLRLKQILLIVVDNAIRYTPKGGEIIIGTFAGDNLGHLTIADTGTGIPGEHLERVFDRFYKVSQGGSREIKNSGLGLSIAKSLLEAQKGSIQIRNRSPRGAEIELTFPIPEK